MTRCASSPALCCACTCRRSTRWRAPPASTCRREHTPMPKRSFIALFLFTLTAINYLDRLALSMAAKPVAQEFHLSPVQLGYLFSSYLWAYVLVSIPMGLLVDRFGARRATAV